MAPEHEDAESGQKPHEEPIDSKSCQMAARRRAYRDYNGRQRADLRIGKVW
jgi:hypothetical protein